MRELNGRRYLISGAGREAGSFPPGIWDLLTFDPAVQADAYSAIVPAEGDSSVSGTEWTVLLVINPRTEIRFDLPAVSEQVTLTIFDVSGRVVRRLLDGPKPAGHHSVAWRGRDERGVGVSSGVYFYRLDSPGASETRKMLLLQ